MRSLTIATAACPTCTDGECACVSLAPGFCARNTCLSHSMLAAATAVQLCSGANCVEQQACKTYTHAVACQDCYRMPSCAACCAEPLLYVRSLGALLTLARHTGRSSGPPLARVSSPLWSLRTSPLPPTCTRPCRWVYFRIRHQAVWTVGCPSRDVLCAASTRAQTCDIIMLVAVSIAL